MTHTRDEMTARFRAILDEATARLPEGMFVNIPVGKLVDAAHDLFDAVPRVPAYDPDVTPEREFCGVITRDDATAGRTNDRVRTIPSDTDYGVTLVLTDGGNAGTVSRVTLPPKDAEEMFLNGLSVVAYQRGEERREATA